MDLSKILHDNSERIFISKAGRKRLGLIFDPTNPQKNIEWTTDFTLELPIKVKKKGLGIFLFYFYI